MVHETSLSVDVLLLHHFYLDLSARLLPRQCFPCGRNHHHHQTMLLYLLSTSLLSFHLILKLSSIISIVIFTMVIRSSNSNIGFNQYYRHLYSMAIIFMPFWSSFLNCKNSNNNRWISILLILLLIIIFSFKSTNHVSFSLIRV